MHGEPSGWSWVWATLLWTEGKYFLSTGTTETSAGEEELTGPVPTQKPRELSICFCQVSGEKCREGLFSKNTVSAPKINYASLTWQTHYPTTLKQKG